MKFEIELTQLADEFGTWKASEKILGICELGCSKRESLINLITTLVLEVPPSINELIKDDTLSIEEKKRIALGLPEAPNSNVRI